MQNRAWRKFTFEDESAVKVIGKSTIADAILERLIHETHGIEIADESMRKITI